jgi:hypothetical protein
VQLVEQRVALATSLVFLQILVPLMHTHLDLVEVAQRAAVQMLVLMEVQETLVLAVRAAEEHLEAINLILVLQMSMLVLLVLVMLLVVVVVDFQLQMETITITGVLQEDLVALV